MTWDEFRVMVIQTTQPSLGTVVALTQLQKVIFKDNLNYTLEEIWKHATQAYPGATPAELQQHAFTTLLRILPKAIANHFTLHDPLGFDQDIRSIRKILISQTSTMNAVNIIRRQTSLSPHKTLRRNRGTGEIQNLTAQHLCVIKA